jgi:PAS domain S-box-containing protein
VASFLSSIVSAITRRWGRADDRVEPDQLETIADIAPAIVWITAADKSCTYVNEHWLRFSGRTREEELGSGWVSAMHPDDLPRCIPLFEAAFDARQPVDIEYRQRRHDGVFRWMLSRGVPRFDRHGNFSGYIGVAFDVDDMRAAERDQKRLAAEVAHERERLLGIVSNVPGVVWEAWGQPDESTQRIDFISEHVTRMLGYTVGEWLSTPNFWLTIVHPDDREAAAAHAHEHFLAGGTRTNTFRWMTKDGRAIWCEAHSTVIHDEQGVPVGMRGVTLDISARKLAEESLRAAAIENEQLYRAAVDASAAKELGPGLAIVQNLVELPASDDAAEALPVAIAAPQSAAPDLRLKQILVVDNDVESLESIAGVLREYGAGVTTARTAGEAILALCAHHDLVVTDVAVVVTEGVTLAQQLRQAIGGVPALLLRKPVDPLDLASEIGQLLTRSGAA